MKNTKIFLSIITPTLNNEMDLEHFLKSLRKQTYFDKTEIIIADGGSKDRTLEIARRYGAKIIHNKDVFADPGVDKGMKVAEGELFMVLASDNIFKEHSAIEKIVKIFKKNSKIFAAFPKQATSKKDTIYTNYINTFTDPASHFVYGYASNPRTFEKIYKIIDKNSDFLLFDFKSNPLVPLISFAQGFTIRAGFKRNKRNEFDDISPVIELIEKNKKIAYVYSVEMYHHTINGLSHFINKQRFKTRNYLEKKNFGIYHRVKLLSENQTSRIRIWPAYSLSIIAPFIYAFYHLVKDKEKMWIFHPFLCIISGYTSLITFLGFKLRK